MISMLRAVDDRPWVLPLAFSGIAGGLCVLYGLALGDPVSFTASGVRQQVYTSLSGTSGSLLGFLIAAVTILAAFGKRPTTIAIDQARENRLARARTKLVILLLVAALFMLTVLVSSTIALALSNVPSRLVWWDAVILSASIGGSVGIIYGGIGLGLTVAERGR